MRRAALAAALVALAGCSDSIEGSYHGRLDVVSERTDGPERHDDDVTVTVTEVDGSRFRAELDGCSFVFSPAEEAHQAELLRSGSCTCAGMEGELPVGAHTVDHRDTTLVFELLAARGSEPGCRYSFRGERGD